MPFPVFDDVGREGALPLLFLTLLVFTLEFASLPLHHLIVVLHLEIILIQFLRWRFFFPHLELLQYVIVVLVPLRFLHEFSL